MLFAVTASLFAGIFKNQIANRIKSLEKPKFRQELILKNKNYEVYNDSAATSPEATIAAIEKYKHYPNFVLICGGTDKELDFFALAQKIKKDLTIQNLFLLEDSATDKLTEKLGENIRTYESLEEIIKDILRCFQQATIVFSPGAASFEKFQNEFDRGTQFNRLAKKYFT